MPKIGDLIKIKNKVYCINGISSLGKVYGEDYPKPNKIYDLTKFFKKENK